MEPPKLTTICSTSTPNSNSNSNSNSMEPHEAVNDIVKAEPTALRPSRRILAVTPPLPPTVVMRWDQSSSEVKLAAISVSLNVRPRSADMPASMQERAFRCTRSLLDNQRSTKPSHTHIARSLKKEFDGWYGPAWQCVVGKSFGSFVTHAGGGFVYFTLDDEDDDNDTNKKRLSVLLFKTAVRPVIESQAT
ncbi:hypothetical protein Syun_012328 [Stephania yunnanensis]|uniref:Dynein light chain n=1 Tax=Stephania yunnanensis TaxID=152371 RepID=A0AAP0PF78_9MAGN